MISKTFLFVSLLVLFLIVPAAHAVPMLSIQEESDHTGTFGSIPGGAENDIIGDIYPGETTRDGYYGSTVYLTEAATVSFTYLGFEAGYVNDFGLKPTIGDIFTNQTSPKFPASGSSVSYTLGSGLLQFYFDVNNNSFRLFNGDNPDDSEGKSGINFFTSFDSDPAATIGTSLVVFLDDGGASNDDNHDDMAVRISVAPAPVPEPTTLLLVGTGLIGLAGARRKMKNA